MSRRIVEKLDVLAVAKMFAVLADPTRLSILRALMLSPATVGELVITLRAKQANVSKQLAVLRRVGFVSGARQWNTVTYRIASPVVKKLCQVVCEHQPGGHHPSSTTRPGRR